MDIPVIVLDRPNPNGHYIDGPMLNMEHKSFVGMHPVPLVYGMTIGEYAQMVNGEKWIPISNNLPPVPVNCIFEDPLIENLLFAGTDYGVYASFNRGQKWFAISDQLPAASVQDMHLIDNNRFLIIATHGMGLFKTWIEPIRQFAQSGNPDEFSFICSAIISRAPCKASSSVLIVSFRKLDNFSKNLSSLCFIIILASGSKPASFALSLPLILKNYISTYFNLFYS